MRSSFFLESKEIPITWGIAGDNSETQVLSPMHLKDQILKIDNSHWMVSDCVAIQWWRVIKHARSCSILVELGVKVNEIRKYYLSTRGNLWLRIRVRRLRKNYGNEIKSNGVQFLCRGAPDKINRAG